MTDTARPAEVVFVADGRDRWATARRALESAEGLSVTTVRSVEDAIAAAADCLVVAHDETTDGLAVLEGVRETSPGLPAVVFADGDTGPAASRAVDADVAAFVPASAPAATDRLVDRVRSAVSDSARAAAAANDGASDADSADAGARPAGDGGAVSMPIEDIGIREELRLKSRAMDEAPVGITITDPGLEDNPMVYVNDAFSRLTGYDKSEVVGRNCRLLQGEASDPEAVAAMREAIDAGESVSVELVNYRENGESFWNRVHIAPLRGRDGAVEYFVGFQTDATERRQAELRARRRQSELEHLLVRIQGLLQDVTTDLVQAGSRSEIERALCDRVTADETYEFGWVVAPDYASGRLVASASAGAWSPDPEALAVDLSAASGPTGEAYETGELQVRRDPDELAAVAADAPWLDADTLGGVAAVPLSYGDTTYGVLTLVTTDADALNDHELVVLAALGRMTGTNINALERGRILGSDTATELVLETTDPELFVVALSRETGSFVEFEGSVSREDGTVLTMITTDAAPSAVREVADGFQHIRELRPIHEFEDATLWEFAVGEGSLTTALAERGAKIRSITVTDGTAEITIELPSENETRALVDLVRERYAGTTIVAHRERERLPQSRRGFVAELEARLTERQLTALRKAHASGYYDWNRSVTGEDLARSMDIDRSTYHQHLRAAERKLTEAFFEGTGGEG